MIVVSNSTPLIGLASIGRFDLLRSLFQKLYVPQAVYHETVVTGRDEGGAKREVSVADWIETVAVQDRLAVEVLLDELDLGEAETIVLARELHATWVPMDERKGRRKLRPLNIPKLGTLGVLLAAKETGLIPAIKPEVVRLHQLGFSLSRRVIDEVLAKAGE